MKKKITVIACLMFVAAMMMFAQPAMSGEGAGTPSGLDVEILYVMQVELDSELYPGYDFGLFIAGFNFDNGAEPIVKLTGTPCDFLEGGPFEDLHNEKTLWGILVGCTYDSLPPLPPFGIVIPVINPLVTVQTGPSVHQLDTFNTTLFFAIP